MSANLPLRMAAIAVGIVAAVPYCSAQPPVAPAPAATAGQPTDDKQSDQGGAATAAQPAVLATPAGDVPHAPGFATSAEDPAKTAADWSMPGKDTALTRYSSLDQINAQNVKNLKVAFTFSLGVNRGQEAAPLVVGDTLYVVAPYPNTLFALDLTKPGAPLKWRYDPKPAKSAQGVACCDVVNTGRGLFRRQALFQHARWQYDRGQLGDRQGGVAYEAGRLSEGRDHHHGSARCQEQNHRREFGRRDGRAWMGHRTRQASGKVLWKAFNTGPKPRS